MNFEFPISRRDLIKLAGLTTVGSMLSDASESKVEAATNQINYNPSNVPTLMIGDVCVCGGGASGTAAAINAAKNGAKTILIEKGIALGGLATLGCVYPCMPTKVLNSDTPYITQINERMKRHGVKPLPEVTKKEYESGGMGQYPPEVLTEVYDELCEEYGVEILYNTTLIGVETENHKIKSCIVQTVSGIFKIEAKIFIDGTGDAVLSRYVGVPTEKGSATTGRNQPMSLRFEMSGIDVNKVHKFFTRTLHDDWSNVVKMPFFEFAKWEKTEEFFKRGVASGELTQDDILYIQAFTITNKPNTMSMNCPEMPPLLFSATDPISYSKSISFGRKMIRRLANFFIKNIPGFNKAYIIKEASMVGVRESWRIKGKYYMNAEDYYGCHHFSDAVCRTAYPIDIHDVKLDLHPKLKRGDYYEIPYRALITNEFENLIVVGRCISADFAAQASVRIQPTCMSMGEAAGIASAYALNNNLAVNAIEWNQIPNRSYISQG